MSGETGGTTKYKVVVCAVRGAPLLTVMDCQQDQGKISTRQKDVDEGDLMDEEFDSESDA